MKNILFKHLPLQTQQKAGKSRRSEVGFTIIEVMLVVSIIAIFAAIAAPAWDAFATRQRIRTVNNQVLRTLQTAQAEAKRTKQEITVTFDESVDPPQYQIGNQPEEDLNLNGEVPQGQIQIYVQANGNDAIDAITFDYMGAVIDPEKIPDPQQKNTNGFTVTVSTPDGGFKQCVKVVTLLGAMITSEGNNCP
ncbi:MAG: GspH/FimT family pseudopilin [Lyngbya sp.]|nr:GspH/FimT family pseudopilin [Lyngbya sp.]